MKKTFKHLFSMEMMIVFLLFLACACAVATFVENDYGTLNAKSFIYGQTWFETIMLVLTLGVIANIIYFKMYQKKKFFILLIHVSLIFIFLGSALTRYMGYEGIMTIPEGSMQTKMISADDFIHAKLINNKTTKATYEQKVLMTTLNQTSFETVLNESDPIHIVFNSYIQNAEEKIVDDKTGEPLIHLVINKFKGVSNHDLKDKDTITSQYLNFAFNTTLPESNKPNIYFETKDNIVTVQSNVTIYYATKKGKAKGSIKPNTKEPLNPYLVYTVGQTRFTTPEFTALGKLKTVPVNHHDKKKKNETSAVLVDITYKQKTQTVSLLKEGINTKGFKRFIQLGENQLELQWGAKEIELPFAILLNDFDLQRYPGSQSPSMYTSDIKVYDTNADEPFSHMLSMNQTLDYRGYRFFQSSYKMDESATILSVNKDPGKVPTYIGYFLLFTGLILSLIAKNSRFRKLANKKYTIENVKANYIKTALFLAMISFIPTTNYANEIYTIDKKHAEKLGSILIQDYQGRIKPINSLAIEIMNKVMGKTTYKELDVNQLFISMMIHPRAWQEVDFVKVSNSEVRNLLGIESKQKYFSFDDVYNEDGSYKLEGYLEEANAKKPANRSKFDKELIKIDERLNIIYNHFSGAFLKLFPKINDKNNKWLDPTIAIAVMQGKSTSLKEDEAKTITSLMDNYFLALGEKSWNEANIHLENIIHYQNLHGAAVIPSQWKIKAELLFNSFNIFERLTPVYLIIGLALLIAIFFTIFKPEVQIKKLTTIVLVILVGAFLTHTFGLALRWYVSGHAPWSNGYESMIYIAWAIALAGILFSRQSILALSTTGILAGVTLFVAHLSWLEPQITTLAPVLKSYWLTIHVSVITASYGFLALSALLGAITLIFFTLLNPKNENHRFFSLLTSIKEARRINEMSMMVGLVLLVMGNFLGGIWANESWGRYWSWDPKETWTLISIIIYAIILHLHYVKGLNSNFVFAALSLISYSAIVMTYFGVNYYLAGMHSYAAGDPLPIPSFVPISAAIIAVLIVAAKRNSKVI